MSLMLSRGLFVRVTLETDIFPFPVRHLEAIMACHVFPRHRCAAAAAAATGAAAGLAFFFLLHNYNSTALNNQRNVLEKYSTPTNGGRLDFFDRQSRKNRLIFFPLPRIKHNSSLMNVDVFPLNRRV